MDCPACAKHVQRAVALQAPVQHGEQRLLLPLSLVQQVAVLWTVGCLIWLCACCQQC